VNGWRDEKQADARLFADDLRLSLAEARIAGAPESDGGQLPPQRCRSNDGPLDAEFSTPA